MNTELLYRAARIYLDAVKQRDQCEIDLAKAVASMDSARLCLNARLEESKPTGPAILTHGDLSLYVVPPNAMRADYAIKVIYTPLTVVPL